MMRVKRKTIIAIIILLILSAAGLLMGYSYFFPGTIKHIDFVRLPMQSKIMRTFSQYTIDDLLPVSESYDSTLYIQLNEFNALSTQLQPGDILLTNSGRYLSSSFIPGNWKHSLIYLGNRSQLEAGAGLRGPVKRTLLSLLRNDQDVLVLDSSEEGVAIRSFQGLSRLSDKSLLSGLSAYRINRPAESISRFLKYAFDQLGKPYDWDMITGNTDELYCSELIYEGLKQIGIHIESRERIAGRDVVSPNTLADYFRKQGKERNEFIEVFFIQKDGQETSQ